MLDVLPLSLGVDLYDGSVCFLIEKKKSPIPNNHEKIYFTVKDSQSRSISFNVYRGERSRGKDNNWLRKFQVPVPLVPKGKSKVNMWSSTLMLMVLKTTLVRN